MRELSLQYPEDEVTIMELMPAWKRWGYEEGKELGKEEGREEIIRKLLANGFHPDKLAEMLDLPPQEIQIIAKS